MPPKSDICRRGHDTRIVGRYRTGSCKECQRTVHTPKKVDRRRAARFGWPEGLFEQRLAEQGGVCAICRKKTTYMAADHNHETGAPRGVLCPGCNIKVGVLESSELEAVRVYLAGWV